MKRKNILRIITNQEGEILMIFYKDGTIKMKKHGKIN